jgi:hypothetical protein
MRQKLATMATLATLTRFVRSCNDMAKSKGANPHPRAWHPSTHAGSLGRITPRRGTTRGIGGCSGTPKNVPKHPPAAWTYSKSTALAVNP